MPRLLLNNPTADAISNIKPSEIVITYSFLSKALNKSIIGKAKEYATHNGIETYLDNLIANCIFANAEGYKGKIYIELNPRLAFDTEASLTWSEKILIHIESFGYKRSNIGILVPCTWEGLLTAERLTKRGITVCLTHVYSLVQVSQAAERSIPMLMTSIFLIENDIDRALILPLSFDAYLKTHEFETELIASDITSEEQIKVLAPYMTLALDENLYKKAQNSTLCKALETPNKVSEKIHTHESTYRFLLNEDSFASELLARGIRNSCNALRILEQS